MPPLPKVDQVTCPISAMIPRLERIRCVPVLIDNYFSLQRSAKCQVFGDFARFGKAVHKIHECRASIGIVAVLWRGFNSPFEGVRFVFRVRPPKGGADLLLRCHVFVFGLWFSGLARAPVALVFILSRKGRGR